MGDGQLIIPIHTSDRLSFKRCRRRWDVMSDLRQGLKPADQPRPLSFGTAIHKAMEVFYDPKTWQFTQDPQARILLVANALAAFKDEMNKTKARYLRLTGREALDEEDAEKFAEDMDLGVGMLKHYFDYVQRKGYDRFEPVAVEVDFEVDIFTPEEIAEEFPWLPQGTRIVYRGRIDQLIKDPWGEYWIWDHKTTSRMRDTMGFLELDEQLGSYNWALEKMLGIRIAGNIYAEIYKGYPQPLQENKVVRQGRRFSVNKNQTTSYEIAKSQLEEAGEDLDLYEDFLNYLKVDGITYIRRTEVRRNDHELAEIGERIRNEVRDMLDPKLRIYPNPSPFSCDSCPVRQVCVAINDGSDHQWILNTYFTQERRNNAKQDGSN